MTKIGIVVNVVISTNFLADVSNFKVKSIVDVFVDQKMKNIDPNPLFLKGGNTVKALNIDMAVARIDDFRVNEIIVQNWFEVISREHLVINFKRAEIIIVKVIKHLDVVN